MTARGLKTWRWLHKWSSLICTINLLILCVTGLVLIFAHEIDHLLGEEEPVIAEGATRLPAQALLDAAVVMKPGTEPKMLSLPPDHADEAYVRVGPPGESAMRVGEWLVFDPFSGEGKTLVPPTESFTRFMLKLHLDLFAEMPGQLFVGAMGVVFLVSTISGLVIYGPSMKKLAFGMIRFERPTRIVHTDLHNLLGVATLVWALVVGLTGAILSFSPLIIGVWQQTELAEMVARHPAPPARPIVPVDDAMATAVAALPGKNVAFVAMPGTEYTSGHHYAVMLRGNTELTERMLSVALVDGQTGELSELADTPWYIKALLLSGPFHFGDYGGFPLKILWALFTLALTVVTVTGLVIWLKKPKPRAVVSVPSTPSDSMGGGTIAGGAVAGPVTD